MQDYDERAHRRRAITDAMGTYWLMVLVPLIIYWLLGAI